MSFTVILIPVPDPDFSAREFPGFPTAEEAVDFARANSVALHGYPVVEAVVIGPDGELDPDDWE